jgi:hypothetical protein
VLLLLIVVPLIAIVGVLSCCCCQGWCVARFAIFERPAIKFNACCPTYGAKYEPMDESAPKNETSHGGGRSSGHPQQQHMQHLQQPPTHDQYGQYEGDEQYDEQEQQQHDQHQQQHHQSNPYPLQQQPHPQQPYTSNASMLPPPQYADAPAHAQRHSSLPPQQHYQPHALPSSPSFSSSSSSSSSSFSPGDVSLSVVPPGEDYSNTHMPAATGRLTSPAHRGHATALSGAGRTV